MLNTTNIWQYLTNIKLWNSEEVNIVLVGTIQNKYYQHRNN